MLLDWSALECCGLSVACSCFACGLGVVTGPAQPLQVAEVVVVTLLDVVSVGANAIATQCVVVGLAPAACAFLNEHA